MSKVAETLVDANKVSHIAAGVYIKGDITSPSDVRIDGKIEGKIQCSGRVVVGESAEILGTICCGILDFWGTLDGDVFVRDYLSLKSGSKVKGNLNVRKLQVEMGAEFNGSCRMLEESDIDATA